MGNGCNSCGGVDSGCWLSLSAVVDGLVLVVGSGGWMVVVERKPVMWQS